MCFLTVANKLFIPRNPSRSVCRPRYSTVCLFLPFCDLLIVYRLAQERIGDLLLELRLLHVNVRDIKRPSINVRILAVVWGPEPLTWTPKVRCLLQNTPPDGGSSYALSPKGCFAPSDACPPFGTLFPQIHPSSAKPTETTEDVAAAIICLSLNGEYISWLRRHLHVVQAQSRRDGKYSLFVNTSRDNLRGLP